MKKFVLKRLGAILAIAAVSMPTVAEAYTYRPGDISRAAQWLFKTIRDYRPGDMNRMAEQLGREMKHRRDTQQLRTTGFSTRVSAIEQVPTTQASRSIRQVQTTASTKRRAAPNNYAWINYIPDSKQIQPGNGQRRRFRAANRRRITSYRTARFHRR